MEDLLDAFLTKEAYIYRFAARRGNDIALRIGKDFGNHFKREDILNAIVNYELLARSEPIFWPFESFLDSCGSFAIDAFNVGVREGIEEGIKSLMLSRIEYL